MPHKRKRQLEDLLLKTVNSNPIVILNGARQVGKSFLVRELLGESKKSNYVTLDNPNQQLAAQSTPTSFISRSDKKLLMIDEAQKAPILFHAIKEVVDKNREPGQFVLLGSTEFSHKSKVRESLTGRATTLKLFPFNLSETKRLNLPSHMFQRKARVTQDDVRTYLERGGMPGIFSLRDEESRLEKFLEWIDTTIHRDLIQVAGKIQIDPVLARRILEYIATEEETDDAAIAKKLRAAIRKVQSHLELLKAVFAIVELAPCMGSTGRSQHYLCDVGIAKTLGAQRPKKLTTWACLEILSRLYYKGEFLQSKFETFRGAKGGRIEFIINIKNEKKFALKLFDFENIRQQDVQILKSFQAARPDYEVLAFAPIKEVISIAGVSIFPWETMA